MEERTRQIEHVATAELWSLLCTTDGVLLHTALLPYAAESSALLFAVMSRHSDAWADVRQDYRVAVIPGSRRVSTATDASQVPLGVGCASECTGAAAEKAKSLLTSRHADMRILLEDPAIVIVCIAVDEWRWVDSADPETLGELAFASVRCDE